MPDRMPAIKEIEERIANERKSAILSIKSFQAHCSHDKIVHDRDRRICVCCGIEEMVAYHWWPGTTVDGGLYEFMRPPKLSTILNSEYVKKDDVARYRIYI